MKRWEEDEPAGAGGREPVEPQRRAGPSGKLIGAAVATIVLLVFAFQNWERVRVDFLFFSARSRTIVVIVVAALLGFVLGWFVGRPGRAERRLLRGRD